MIRSLFSSLVLLAAVACGGGSAPGVVAPIPDAGSLSRSMQEETAVDRPQLIFFRWSLTEEGLRLGGRGVARVAPPFRARLDLFLDNGEGVAQAVLIDDDLRTPMTLPGGLLPPANLLWGTLGVFRQWPGTEILGAEELEGGGRRIRTRLPDGREVYYGFETERMTSAELRREGSVVQEIRLARDTASVPAEAVYRDNTAFRELIITRERVEYVPSFPDDIWRP